MRTTRYIAPSLVIILFATLLIQLPIAIAARDSVYEIFDPIVDIRRILVDRYVEPPEDEALQRAMIDGMIDTLDDPYTQYIPPVDTDDFNKQLRGTYAGIGAEVIVSDGYLEIVSPMDDSPALGAGVMAGDVVLEIEGESTYEMPITECVDRLTGEVGTPVSIRVRHRHGTEEDLEIIRGIIVTRTVKGLRRAGEDWIHCVDEDLGLGYVRVTQFTEQSTIDELRSTLDGLVADGLRGLILDLRDNPGGALSTAVEVSDLFMSDGAIVTVKPRVGDEDTFYATEEGTLPQFPMVILVNGSSASASEIVSGALQANGRASVLGTRTFGKGSVQEVRPLRYGAGTLKYTTAHYYLLGGRNINRSPGNDTWGVDPDPGFVVPMTDEMYVEAFRARREHGVIEAPEDDLDRCAGAAWIRDELRDEQLALAVEALATRTRDGAWARITDHEPADLAVATELRRAATARARLLEQLSRVEQEIESLQVHADRPDRDPLIPPDAEFVDGTLTIHDRDGNLVGSYLIEGGNLPLALSAVELAPAEDEDSPDRAP